MSDINVIEPTQSFTGNLGVNASFLGPFIGVQDFTSITVTARANTPPASANAIQFEWSSDGVNLDSTTVFGSDGSTEQTAMGTVKAAFFRLRYTAGGGGLTGARVQTLLRTGPFNSSVTRTGLITGSPDALVTNSVLMGKATTTFQAVKAYPDTTLGTDFILAVTQPPGGTALAINTNASLTSVPIDVAGLGAAARKSFTVFNNTIRGNLYVRLSSSAASLTAYDYKVPPQHTLTIPVSWPTYRGVGRTIQGIWDFADGECHVSEIN